MNEEISDLFYLPERDQSFSDTRCFLCGQILSSDNRTDEHIFPKWLLEKFNLWNSEIYLLNDTCIQYRQLTIPCCKTCNGQHLSKLENYIKSEYEKGFEHFKKINQQKLFLWINKLFYGLLFKEILLPLKRNEQNGDRIIPPQLLEKYSLTHQFLQGVRIPMEFPDLKAWSIFILNTKTHNNIKGNFDYKDNFEALTFAIRMGEISVVAILQDNGTQASLFKETVSKLQQSRIHPIQFTEFFCISTYKHLTSNCTPKYLINQHPDSGVIFFPLHFGGTSQPYNIWDNSQFAKLLSFHTKISYDKLYFADKGVMSWLFDNDSVVDIPDEQYF